MKGIIEIFTKRINIYFAKKFELFSCEKKNSLYYLLAVRVSVILINAKKSPIVKKMIYHELLVVRFIKISVFSQKWLFNQVLGNPSL